MNKVLSKWGTIKLLLTLVAYGSYDTTLLPRVRAINRALNKIRPGEKYVRSAGNTIDAETRIPIRAWNSRTIEGSL